MTDPDTTPAAVAKHRTSRRRFIALLGGGTVMAASAVAGAGCSSNEYPAASVQPWARAGAETDLRRHMLVPALPPQWQSGAQRLGLTAGVVSDPYTLQTLRKLTRQAWELEMTTPRTWLESARLLRIGPAAVEQHRDGIAVMGLMPRLLHSVGAFDPLPCTGRLRPTRHN